MLAKKFKVNKVVKLVAVVLAAMLLVGGSVSGAAVQQAKLTASDAAPFDLFGGSVSISGDTILVGAHRDDDGCPDNDPDCTTGAAYVFVRDGDTWSQQAKLTDPDYYPIFRDGEELGYSVSVSGDTAVVGGQWGPWAHIFVRDNTGSWSQQARLIDPEGEISLRRFGRSVSISGDTVLVGSSRGPYVFVRDPGDASGETWIQQARLIASPDPDDLNGNPVSISGDTALIRRRFGSAYVFVRDDTGSWSQQAKLIPSDPASRFGFSVSISGNTALIGAPPAGVAYVFVRNATGSWSEQAKLSTPEGPVGNAVAIRGDTALVASGDVAYVFVRDGTGSWSQVETLFPSDSGEEISISVALGGNSALVGAGREGAVYVFVPEDRPPSDVSIIQPPDGSIFNSGADIVFQATANDPGDGDIRASTVWTSSIQEGSKTGGVFETSNLIDGVHVITATVTDSAGQTARESITITVSNNPPTVSIIQPADGSTFASGSTITFQGTATDPEDGDISDSIVWTSDIQPGSMKGSSATSEEVIDGVHVITASVTDSLGNAASDSITITVGTPQ